MKIKLSAIFLCFLIFSACKSSDNLNVNSSFLEYRGADISYFKQLEENNVQFYKNGKIKSLFEILKDALTTKTSDQIVGLYAKNIDEEQAFLASNNYVCEINKN